MTTLSKRGNRGFTLIELLIVVIIIAILAAIAIPQFTSSTTDAKTASLDANLASVRGAIEMYKAQHGGAYPGFAASTLGKDASGTTVTCTVGANKTGAAGSQDAMMAQLQYYSNAQGMVCDTPSANFKYGPYLRQGLPTEPITPSSALAFTSTGAPIAPAGTAGGWAYDSTSGQFIMNSNAADVVGGTHLYSQH
jgi:prepilin-type N-terminal cleavage/methylation domain-containing protein